MFKCWVYRCSVLFAPLRFNLLYPKNVHALNTNSEQNHLKWTNSEITYGSFQVFLLWIESPVEKQSLQVRKRSSDLPAVMIPVRGSLAKSLRSVAGKVSAIGKAGINEGETVRQSRLHAWSWSQIAPKKWSNQKSNLPIIFFQELG